MAFTNNANPLGIPKKIRLHGDKSKSETFIGKANSILEEAKRMASFQGLDQFKITRTFDDHLIQVSGKYGFYRVDILTAFSGEDLNKIKRTLRRTCFASCSFAIGIIIDKYVVPSKPIEDHFYIGPDPETDYFFDIVVCNGAFQYNDTPEEPFSIFYGCWSTDLTGYFLPPEDDPSADPLDEVVIVFISTSNAYDFIKERLQTGTIPGCTASTLGVSNLPPDKYGVYPKDFGAIVPYTIIPIKAFNAYTEWQTREETLKT